MDVGTMYVEMVDNLTKVLHEQTQEEVVLHQRLRRLERASSNDALDFDAARRATAAKVVQCAWRAKRVRAKQALTIGIQRKKLTQQLATLQASQDAAVQGLHWLAAAEANASTLQTLGVDAGFLADAPRWDTTKRDAAATSIQSAWRCRRAKRGRLFAPLGSPQRIAQEQHDRAHALRQASRHESLVALDVAKLHMQKLAACGVRITVATRGNPPPAKQKNKRCGSAPAYPGMLKYMLAHPIKTSKRSSSSRQNSSVQGGVTRLSVLFS